jgi:hypothetical protein
MHEMTGRLDLTNRYSVSCIASPTFSTSATTEFLILFGLRSTAYGGWHRHGFGIVNYRVLGASYDLLGTRDGLVFTLRMFRLWIVQGAKQPRYFSSERLNRHHRMRIIFLDYVSLKYTLTNP